MRPQILNCKVHGSGKFLFEFFTLVGDKTPMKSCTKDLFTWG